jgi:hypothetical protein
MKKQVSELSDRELGKAEDRAWRSYYRYRQEQSRRKLIERYGADNPELNTYTVSATVEGSFDVKARSEEEAGQIFEDWGVWLDYADVAQIEAIDGPFIGIDSIEVAELEDAAD